MKLGIVGCGLIGQKRALAASGHTISFVCDTDSQRARELAKTAGAEVSPTYKELVAQNIDAVIVATTHDMLVPVTLAGLAAGKHVLVEKPAARTAKEFLPVISAAQKAGRIVKVGFNHRFHPALRKAHEIVASGRFGPILFIRAKYGHGGRIGYEKEWRCIPEISGGGELIDQGSHLIDLSRWFLGELSLDYADAPTYFWNIPVDDNCFLALSNSSGAKAWLHAGWTEWKNTFCFEIMGKTGKLTIEGLGKSYGTETLTIHAMRPEMGPPDTEVIRFEGEDRSWHEEFADFAAAVEQGKKPCGDMHDALANLAIIDKVYKR